MREALHAATDGGLAAPEQVLGVLSLIFWTLTVTVSIKYIGFVLRADNNGEGGILSLIALVRASFPTRPIWILVIGIFGAALFLGDAVITPAISVLPAVEGVEVVTPAFHFYVVPLTLVILAVLFAVQRFGTSKVATNSAPSPCFGSSRSAFRASYISSTIRTCLRQSTHATLRFLAHLPVRHLRRSARFS